VRRGEACVIVIGLGWAGMDMHAGTRGKVHTPSGLDT